MTLQNLMMILKSSTPIELCHPVKKVPCETESRDIHVHIRKTGFGKDLTLISLNMQHRRPHSTKTQSSPFKTRLDGTTMAIMEETG